MANLSTDSIVLRKWSIGDVSRFEIDVFLISLRRYSAKKKMSFEYHVMKALDNKSVRRHLQLFRLYPAAEPDFFVLGTQKGGTTALYHSLRSHPNIVAPIRKKELHFFDKTDKLTTSKIKAIVENFTQIGYAKTGLLSMLLRSTYLMNGALS